MKNERGFTLVEMLLAVTLFAIVMSSGFGVFKMGLQIWTRMQGHSSVERKTLLSLEKIGRDLRTAIRIPEQKESLRKPEIEYGGSNQEFSFPALVTKAGKKGVQTTQFGRMTYRFESSAKVLCKQQENATDFYLKRPAPCDPVAQGIQSAKFRYWLYDKIGKEYDWYDEWEMTSGLPKAVSLSFVQNPTLKGVKKFTQKEYHQTWIIPAGGTASDSEALP